MTTRYLRRLRRLSAHQAWASRRLGRGKTLHCHSQEDTAGYLTLQRTWRPEPVEHWLHLDTAAGPLCLDSANAEAWLNRLSDLPFVMAADDDAQDWCTALYNQHLLPAFAQLFGHIRPTAGDDDDANGQTYLLGWRLGGHSGHLGVTLGDATLERLLDRAPWHDTSRLDVGGLPLTVPLRLGRLQLEKDAIQGLGNGDVIIPSQPMFSVEGAGLVQLGAVRLQLQHQDEGTQATYRVTHLETATRGTPAMDDDHDMDTGLTPPSPQQEPASTDMGIPATDTNITLSLQAGEVSLSLEELSQLQEGSILTATGEAPGYATLYHHRRPIARGELVEVEGRLGLQLTQVLLPPQTDDAG